MGIWGTSQKHLSPQEHLKSITRATHIACISPVLNTKRVDVNDPFKMPDCGQDDTAGDRGSRWTAWLMVNQEDTLKILRLEDKVDEWNPKLACARTGDPKKNWSMNHWFLIQFRIKLSLRSMQLVNMQVAHTFNLHLGSQWWVEFKIKTRYGSPLSAFP